MPSILTALADEGEGSLANEPIKMAKGNDGKATRQIRATTLWRISYIALGVCLLHLLSKTIWRSANGTPERIDDATTNDEESHAEEIPFVLKKVNPGWDSVGWKLYNDRVASLPKTAAINTTVYPPGATGPFSVSMDTPGNPGFWPNLQNGGWERHTFHIFLTYINPNTTVVDFGTWIGPTLLYHGQYSRRSFGIEADPVAFAVAEYNIELNRKWNSTWADRVTLDSACISRPEDVGNMTMKAAKAPGASMSGIGDKLARKQNGSWTVRCYTLPDIFENYWGIHKPYKDVFIKIDIESYECKLIPSFYDWLKDEEYLPKMYISFHREIEFCKDDEWEGILKVLRLYHHVKLDGINDWRIKENTTVEDLKGAMRTEIIVYQNHHYIVQGAW